MSVEYPWTFRDVSRLADQQGQDLQNARQHIAALTAERDDEKALRIKAIDRLDEALTERDGMRDERDDWEGYCTSMSVAWNDACRERDALRAEADGLRKEVDRLTELVKLDAGTIRLREEEADRLREQLASSVRDVKAVLETNSLLWAALEGWKNAALYTGDEMDQAVQAERVKHGSIEGINSGHAACSKCAEGLNDAALGRPASGY